MPKSTKPKTIKLRGQTITPEWKFAQVQLTPRGKGSFAGGSNRIVYFNPVNPSQRVVLTDRVSSVDEFITQDRRQAEVQPENLPQFFERSKRGGMFHPTQEILQDILVTPESRGRMQVKDPNRPFGGAPAAGVISRAGKPTGRQRNRTTLVDGKRRTLHPGERIVEVRGQQFKVGRNAKSVLIDGERVDISTGHTLQSGIGDEINRRAGGRTRTTPTRTTGQTYTVQPGDTRSGIAAKLGVSLNDVGLGRSGNPDLIFPDEVLTIGGAGRGGATGGGTVGGRLETPQEYIKRTGGLVGFGTNRQVVGGQQVTTSPPAPTTGAAGEVTPSDILSELQRRAGEEAKTPKDDLVDKLVDALAQSRPAGGLEGEFEDIQEDVGVPEAQETVGDFNTEIQKARDLLVDLESSVRRGMTREETRLAPMEIITGRQRELELQAGEKRQDLLGLLDSLATGKTLALEDLTRKDKEVATRLGLREADLDRPIEELETELSLRQNIQEVIQSQFPEIVTSSYNDRGDLTIVVMDPATGEFSTRTIKGIGKVTQTKTKGGGSSGGDRSV